MSDPYAEGYEAYSKAIKQADNPHTADEEKHAQWDSGWEDAKIEAEQKRGQPCYEDREERLG